MSESGDSKRARSRSKITKITNLATHPARFVTVSALAKYWMISPKQIYKQIEANTLPTLRLGPRLYRIRTRDAERFEKQAKLGPAFAQKDAGRDVRKVSKTAKAELSGPRRTVRSARGRG
jgi:predicted DNA-binding transcriptional regulator AlpA